jgi:hypothetical protein
VSLKSDMQEGIVEVSWRRQRGDDGDVLVWLWSVFVHHIESYLHTARSNRGNSNEL